MKSLPGINEAQTAELLHEGSVLVGYRGSHAYGIHAGK